ncbi:MAG TPA: organic solvent tolerance ABC transporter substrate-binding protein, partial [Desulfobacterales bacterium]|nr:organic solvent tolerance ABC transporter substrate-binding protein [Desulfobacterales bacterium]
MIQRCRFWSGCCLMITVLVFSSPAWAGPATDQLRTTVDEVIRLLGDQSLKSQKQQRRQRLRQVINQRF